MFAVANTDQDWFEFLRSHKYSQDVNFWTPTPWSVRRLQPGDTWHFLLKSPIRALGGYGVFKEYRRLSIQDAWQTYDIANGVSSVSELLSRCREYSKRHSGYPVTDVHSLIGCVILSDPEFYEDDGYLELGRMGIEFDRHIVKFKYFDGIFPWPGSGGSSRTSDEREFAQVVSDYTESCENPGKKGPGHQRLRSQPLKLGEIARVAQIISGCFLATISVIQALRVLRNKKGK